MHFSPLRSICRVNGNCGLITIQTLIGCSHTMNFNIGFINYIKTIFICHSIEKFVFRIMTTANSIDIVLLHHFHIFQCNLFTDHMPGYFIMIMKVYAFDQYGHTVHQKLIVLDLNFSKSDF